MAAPAPFELAAELLGHEGAARCILPLDGGQQLITGGEDGTVKRWLRAQDEQGAVTYECLETIPEAEHWVLALLALPPGVLEEAPNGGFIAASQDKMIRVYDLEGRRLRLLVGHGHGVISLSWLEGANLLLSGSWDGTAKAWDVAAGECVLTLEGHENGVSVLALPTGDIATASTGREEGGQVVDAQIRLWRDGKLGKQLKEHTGPVRSLALLPEGLGFCSTSNDGTIRLWSLDGEPLAMLPAPPGPDGGIPFLYKAAAYATPDGTTEVASVGEDGGALVWRGQEVVQRIQHPRGAWAVVAVTLPDGSIELATACHDGFVRVFTRDPSHFAAEGVRAAFAQAGQEAAEKAQRGAGGPSAEEIARLPDWDARAGQRGKREGMVQMFRKGQTAIAAQWSDASGTWIEIGEVTGASNAGVINGKSYDHVFPIEIEQPGGLGVQNLQIGYNNGDNPFQAAQAFIDEHMLPQRYLAQIADYITERARQAAPMIGGGAAGSVAAAAGAGGGFNGVGDPSKAASSASAAAAFAGAGGATGRHFPQVVYLAFDAGQLDKILGKIVEFAAATSEAIDQPALEALIATLGATNRYHATEVKPNELKALLRLLDWPADKVFPALDLLRMTVLHPTLKGGLPPTAVDKALSLAEANPGSAPVVMLTLRLLTNLAKHMGTRALLTTADPPLLERGLAMAAAHGNSGNKSVRGAAAGFLLNAAVLLSSAPVPDADARVAQLIAPGLASLLSLSPPEEDGALKATVALGTLLSKPATAAAAKAALASGVGAGLKATIAGLASLGGVVQEAVSDLTPLLG